ncbi:MAG TPA: hypothetical protein VGE66_17025 [Chitinophagaceae bacterium]
MKFLVSLLLGLATGLQGCAQANQQEAQIGPRTGGPCEGCEAIYESPVPFGRLSWRDTLPDYGGSGEKLHLGGTVYKADGRTPAPGVVLYIYHTDQTGVYPTHGNEKGWDKRHGYLRGWIRTNSKGEYAFYTLKPIGYNNGRAPAHIHITVKEPDVNEYWVDEYLFADDPQLSKEDRERASGRGGSGLVQTQRKGDILVAKRDIILGKNVPGYQ